MSPCPQVDCLHAAGLSSDQVLLPSETNYAVRQSSYSSRSAQSLQPSCIVQPRSSSEVAAVVQSLVAAHIPFAVRSGGHMAWAGANNIGADGVTVDLGQMDWVRVLNDKERGEKVVDIGPGTQWGRVYAELEAHELTVAGGREANVGVAGLVLGGGMAFFTGRHGLACDNIIEFELVLASGLVVHAGAEGDHADLFRALKGGGGNFGIVTNFRMRTIAARLVWAGMTIHPKEVVLDAISALTSFVDDTGVDVDSNLLCFFTYMPDFKDVVITGALIQTAGVEEAASYKKWLDMPMISNTCKKTPISQLAKDFSQARGYYNTWFTATFKNDARIVARAVDLHEKLVEEFKALIPDGDFITQCLFQPFPRLFGQVSAAAGGNMTGIERQQQNGLVWLAVAQVRTADLEKLTYTRVRDWVHAVRQFAATIEGGILEWTYLNYADGSQDPLASYGVDNVRFMRDIAAKYDRSQVFQTLCPGGFKISKSSLPN
ncbi:hypothetical protein F5Y10DRAFT_254872 [Nemania abortiva]|nr:hypothetical protein F5Y10DRAFT_254872 [Nemania abortiva]